MFTINPESSCIAFGIVARLPQNRIFDSIRKVLDVRNESDIIISKYGIDKPDVFERAILYLDVEEKPDGLPLYCMLCSVKIHEFITDWEFFLKSLAKEIGASVFIDSNNRGYLVEMSGNIEEVKFETFFLNQIECLRLV